MDIFTKVAPRQFERLRSQIPTESPARKAINKVTRIDHAVDSIPCDEEQARILLEIAKQHCPEIVRDIEQALRQPRSDRKAGIEGCGEDSNFSLISAQVSRMTSRRNTAFKNTSHADHVDRSPNSGRNIFGWCIAPTMLGLFWSGWLTH